MSVGKIETNAIRKIVAGFLVVSLLVPIGISIQLGEDARAENAGQVDARHGYWGMERGNSQRDGTSIFNVSELKPHVIWDIDLTKMARWNESNSYITTFLTAVAKDGTIYLANSENVSAIYPNGTLRWTIGLTEIPYMSPAVGGNGDLYIGTIFEGNGILQERYSAIYAIHPNGSIRWRVQLPEIDPMPLLVDESNTIYASVYGFEPADQNNITVTSNVLVAIAANGSIMWKYSIPVKSPQGGLCIPAIAPDGTIRFQTESTLVAINKNGSTKWSFDLPSRGPYDWNDPLVTDNGTTISICNQTLLSIDPEGGLQWSYDIQSSFQLPIISNSRWLIYANNMIYICNQGWPDFLAAIRDNGTLAWTIFNDEFSHHGPAMSHNGLILILNQHAQLEAIAANGTRAWITEPLYTELSSAGPTEVVIGGEDSIYIRHFGNDLPWSLVAVGYEVEQPIASIPLIWISMGLVIIMVVVGGFLLWRRGK